MPSAPLNSCGDGINSCHDLKYLINEPEHILVYCVNCKHRYYVKPQDKKACAKLFKKDILQPNSNLYYKYYGRMNVLQ